MTNRKLVVFVDLASMLVYPRPARLLQTNGSGFLAS